MKEFNGVQRENAQAGGLTRQLIRRVESHNSTSFCQILCLLSWARTARRLLHLRHPSRS
jgi:hypothetical protein